MTKTTVVSGCSPDGHAIYGCNFLSTFAKFWAPEVDLIYYTEEPVSMPRGERRDAFDCRGLKEFLDRNSGNPDRCGRGNKARWSDRAQRGDYNYRFDAIRFCKQLYYPEHAAGSLQDGEILAWSDADVIYRAPIAADFVDRLLGDADLVFLGREPMHSEIGFWAVRLNAGTRRLLHDVAQMYRTDEVFKLREWHSAYVWDHCRRAFERKGGKARNLTPAGRGSVFEQSPLGKIGTHLKGKRKFRQAA